MRKPTPLTPPPGRVYGYARVSTEDQSLEMQIAALVKAGVDREFIYSETVSGAKRRPRLEALLKGLDPGDTLVVWKLDRLGRSLIDLLKKFEWFEANAVAFRSLTESIDTATPGGRLLMVMLGALAQFERDLIMERTREGMRVYRERGGKVGKERVFTPPLVKEARDLIRNGSTVAQLSKRYGITPTTIYNYIPGPEVKRLQAMGPKRKRKR